jgi:hypothetical protein
VKNEDKKIDQEATETSEVDLVTPVVDDDVEDNSQEETQDQTADQEESSLNEKGESFISRYIRIGKESSKKGAACAGALYKKHEPFIKKNKLYIGLGGGAVVLVIIIGSVLIGGHSNEQAEVRAYQQSTQQQSQFVTQSHTAAAKVNPAKFNNQFAVKKSESINSQMNQLQAEQGSNNRMMSQVAKTQVTMAQQISQLAKEVAAVKEMGSKNPEVIKNIQASVAKLKAFQKSYEAKVKAFDSAQSQVRKKLSEVVNSRPVQLKLAEGWSVIAATNQSFFLENSSGKINSYRVNQDVPGLGVIKGPGTNKSGEEILLIGKDYYIPFSQQSLEQ